MNRKKKKILIPLILLFALLLLPFPTGTYKDGGTKTYTALTYKIVDWNRLYAENTVYDQTRVYPFPLNFMPLDRLFEQEEKALKSSLTPNNSENQENPTLAKYSKNYANMSVLIPNSWACETVDDDHSFGINFWPVGHPEGKLKLSYQTAGFAVCGTGLTQEPVTLNSYQALKGTYDNHQAFDFIHFTDTAGTYVVLNEGAEIWWEQFGNEAMSILNTVTLGAGALRKKEAISRARPHCTHAYDTVQESFDYKTGRWEICFYQEAAPNNKYQVILGPDGNVIHTAAQPSGDR